MSSDSVRRVVQGKATVLKVKWEAWGVPFACGVRRLEVTMTIGGDTPKGNGTSLSQGLTFSSEVVWRSMTLN